MQPLRPELVAHRSSPTSSLRRVAVSSLVTALLLVAAAALASSQSITALADNDDALAMPTVVQIKAAEGAAPAATPTAPAAHSNRPSPPTVMEDDSAYVNAFNGRGSIGKKSHDDFGKVAMDMIKMLDKQLPSKLPSNSLQSSPRTAPVEHWSDKQVHIKARPVKLGAASAAA